MGFTHIWKLDNYLVPTKHRFECTSQEKPPWIVIDWNNFHMGLSEWQGGHMAASEQMMNIFCTAIATSGYHICVIKDGAHDGSRAVIKFDRMLQKIIETSKLDLSLTATLEKLDSKYLIPEFACKSISNIFEKHLGTPGCIADSSNIEVKYISHTAAGEADPAIRKFAREKAAQGCDVYIISADGSLVLGVPETVSLVPIKSLSLTSAPRQDTQLESTQSPPVLLGDCFSVAAVCSALTQAGNDVMQALNHPVFRIVPVNTQNLTIIYSFLEGENMTNEYLFNGIYSYLDNFLLPYEHPNELIRTLRRTPGWWTTTRRRLILVSLFVRAAMSAAPPLNSPENMIAALYDSAVDPNNLHARIYGLRRMNVSSYWKVCSGMTQVNREVVIKELRDRHAQVTDRLQLVNTCKVQWPRRTALEPLRNKEIATGNKIERYEPTYRILNGLLSLREQVDVVREKFIEWNQDSEGGATNDEYIPCGSVVGDVDVTNYYNAWMHQFKRQNEQSHITLISTDAQPGIVTEDHPPGTGDRFDRRLLYTLVNSASPPGNPDSLPQSGLYLSGMSLGDNGFRWGLSFTKNSPIQSEVHVIDSRSPLLNLERRGDMFDRIYKALHVKTNGADSICQGEEFMLNVILGMSEDNSDRRTAVKNATESINSFLDYVGCNSKSSSSFGNLIFAVAHSFLLVASQFHTFTDWFSPHYSRDVTPEQSAVDGGQPVSPQLIQFMQDIVRCFLYSAMFSHIEKVRTPEGVPIDNCFGGRSVKDIKAEICEHNRSLLQSILSTQGVGEEGMGGSNKVATARVVEIVEKIADQWKDIYGDYSSVSWLDMQGMWIALSALVPDRETHVPRLVGYVQQHLGVDEDFVSSGGVMERVVAIVVDTLCLISY